MTRLESLAHEYHVALHVLPTVQLALRTGLLPRNPRELTLNAIWSAIGNVRYVGGIYSMILLGAFD